MIPFALGLDAVIAVLKRFKVLILVLPLLMALGVQSCRLSRAESKLDKARTTIAQMETASEAARQAQITLNAQNAQLAQRIADNATSAHVQNRAAVSRAVSSYSAAHGMRQACGRVAGQADSPAVPSGPNAPDSTDGNEVLAVSREDFERLAHDAMRGAEARAFLIDLINEGLAVPAQASTP